MKIALGSDHAGFRLKEKVRQLLGSLGHEVEDFGTTSETPVDYPKFIVPAAEAVARGECERGIVFGGSGNGEATTGPKGSATPRGSDGGQQGAQGPLRALLE